MITVYPYDTLGGADHGWLKTKHHFSFANYYDLHRMGFGELRVINDDLIKAGTGFGMHQHADMEIITFVRKGAITHKDSRGNEGRTEAGDVQVMSAGTGIFHSEYNMENEDTVIYQIWIFPRETGVQPRWDSATFARDVVGDQLPLLVSGRKEDEGKGALYIHQDAAIYGGRVKAGTEIRQSIKDGAYILASVGSFSANGTILKEGDGAEVTGEKMLVLKAETDAEILVIDVPAIS